MPTHLKVGSKAPDFKLMSHKDAEVSLSDYAGKKTVILAFYPLDFSPVCSVQIPDYHSKYNEFKRHNVEIIGISRDSLFAHKAWSKELGGVDFPLLADVTNDVAKKYGVFMPEKGINGRAIFVIDKNGVIQKIHEEAELKNRRTADELLDMLAALPV
jgi:alkyl hydroperoxide reductase subunit AhpC